MKIIFNILLVVTFFIGCGGGDNSISNNLTTNADDSLIIAKDNMLRAVQKPFDDYILKVITDKKLEKDETSKDTTAIYGYINGKNTKALLKLNSNYPKGTKMSVKVFDKTGKKALAESEQLVYDGKTLHFGDLEVEK